MPESLGSCGDYTLKKNADKEKDLLKDLFQPLKPISQRITFQAKVGIQLLLLLEHNLSQKLTAPLKGLTPAHPD